MIVVKAILSLNFNINLNNNKSNNAFKFKKMGIWGLPLYVSELPCVPLVLRILVCFWVFSICSQIFWQSIYWLSSFASSEIHPFGLFKFYCLICFVQHSWLPCSLCTRPWWSVAYFIGSPLKSNFLMFDSLTQIQYFDQFAKTCKPEHSLSYKQQFLQMAKLSKLFSILN